MFNQLLNNGNLPTKTIQALHWYQELLTSDAKKSIQYYQSFENKSIPRWKIYDSLPQLLNKPEIFQKQYLKWIWQELDRRSPVVLALDDFVVKRYGHSAFATGYFHSNAHGGITWGNLLVDVTLKNGSLECPVSYEIHEKPAGFKLWERGQRQIDTLLTHLLAAKVREKRIWVVADSAYGNKTFQHYLRSLNVSYLLGIPKNRTAELFGRKKRLDHFFVSLPERTITIGTSRYTYKQTILNLKGWGRRQVLAVKRGAENWKYYVTNNLRATVRTLLKRLNDRWSVEDTHRSLKNYHGGEHFYVWSKEKVKAHFVLAYLSCGLAYLERYSNRKKGVICTMESLHNEALQNTRHHLYKDQPATLEGIN